ncbi:VCBS repeat-containing protein, partial [Trichodesmium erythraeum 21-75]|nr:VCBS repeat-containing protein [Trichodesmium erythraeum 21-75]
MMVAGFTEQTISTNADGASSVFAADVDGDGDVDVLSASQSDDKIALYLNEGSNVFAEQTISTNADGAVSVHAADVDGDGDVDILSASQSDDKIALYVNDGSNNFTEQVISNNADGASSVFAADMDGDRDVDILSASNYNKIVLYENSISTVSINATETPAEAGAIPGTFTIDRGADTRGDLIVFFAISGTAKQNIDYDIQGARTLENTAPTVAFNGKKGSVVIPHGQTRVDIKVVPRDDLVVDEGETVTFTLTEAPTGGLQQYHIPEDKTATLTITDNTNPPPRVVGENKIVISYDFEGAESVFAADVDGDGDMDVLSASYLDNKIALYLNDGSNNFTEQTISNNAWGARSVFAADVDGDGDMDVLSASEWDDKIALYLNDGSNNFTEQTISNNADGARSVFAADVDGDGDMDVLSGSNKTSLYLNDGSNNFTEQTISNNGARSVLASDVNGDGYVDVLSTSWSRIYLYLNDGSNNFTGQTISTNADGAISVFAADVDSDGDVDVLSASWNQISLYLNDGSNNFTEQIISTNVDAAFSVFAADVDGDGDVDILSASGNDGKTALYVNDGRNNFTEQAVSKRAINAKSVFAADMDGDGDVDVLSAEWNKISLYETSLPTIRGISVNATGRPAEARATPGTFTIDRNGNRTGDLTVFFTISGTAQQNIDYDIQGARTLDNTVATVTFDGQKGSIVIPDGQTRADIRIVPRNDLVADAGETVTLTLTEAPTGVPQQYELSSTAGDETATLTIRDNTNPGTKVLGENENIISTNADGASSVFAADVDRDGDLDILSASREDDKIVLYINNGRNNFTEETISTSADGASSVFAADVDSDGDLDILSA